MTNAKDINLEKLASELDEKIYEAIRQTYGYGEEAELLVDHFSNILSDAASYYGSYSDRLEQMYSIFDYARLDDYDIDKLAKDYELAK
jgi:hypothetical protein